MVLCSRQDMVHMVDSLSLALYVCLMRSSSQRWCSHHLSAYLLRFILYLVNSFFYHTVFWEIWSVGSLQMIGVQYLRLTFYLVDIVRLIDDVSSEMTSPTYSTTTSGTRRSKRHLNSFNNLDRQPRSSPTHSELLVPPRI